MQSHGILKDLLSKNPDHIFIPQVKYAHMKTGDDPNCTCPFVQGEPYYLRAAFHDDLAHRMLTEVLDFSSRIKLQKGFINIGQKLGFGFRRSVEAFEAAWEVFLAMDRKMKDQGRLFLSSIKPDETSIVLFGRSYNAFIGSGNMGIPQKFTSRGHGIAPYDFLPLDELGGSTVKRMYWASGQGILQAAEYVSKQPNLFGVYITNFSCGPDSFIAERFKTIMGNKPFLTLELDDHTADAGIDTRVEAFLDVVKGYREVNVRRIEKDNFIPAETFVHQDRL
jgi:predicted nucleotide-binding protein (sugar kinase/HSP70/actin superfamily)